MKNLTITMRNSYVLALNDVHIFASHTLLILPVCLNIGFHLHLFVTREHRENIEMCALPGVQYNDEVRGQYLFSSGSCVGSIFRDNK